MFSDELKSLLVQVISSWQVLAVAGVLVIYVFLVNYVARTHRRYKPPPMPKIQMETPEAPSDQAESDTEDLGLEEEKEEK